MHWRPGAVALNLRIDVGVLRRHVVELTGEAPGPLRFDLAAPPTPTTARRWNAVVDFLAGLPQDTGHASPLWIAELERFVVGTLLSTHTNTIANRREFADTTVAGRSARLAHDHLIENADESISLHQLARNLGITPRALQLAFRRNYDMTPREFLRSVRLQRAHLDLVADPDATISAIAHRWGFSSPSRFAAHYRATFGQPPSRARSGAAAGTLYIS